MRRRVKLALVWLGAVIASTAACADDGASSDGTCVVSRADTCSPLYSPTWNNIYERTIDRKCAQGGSACHGAAPGQGGLVLKGADEAYAALLASYVVPNDATCSDLMVRLHSDVPGIAMPPGSPLSDAERCSVEQWIAAGASP